MTNKGLRPIWRFNGNYLLRTNNFTGDGGTTVWNIGFADGYISPDDVKARYVDETGNYVDIVVNNVSGNVVTITPAQPAGRVFQIYRDTRKESPLVNFADGAIINETNLDTLATQAIMVAAEASDLANGLAVTANRASVDAESALELAQEAEAAATQAAADAAAAASDADTAQAAATNAAANAAAANANANEAKADADAALIAANAAVVVANAADDKASAATIAVAGAVADANEAKADAASALSASASATSVANAAASDASAALTASEDAVETANCIDAKATQALADSADALTQAAAAVSTANDAEATANAIDGKAQDALDTADAAATTAANAESVANSIDAKATQALSESGTALTKAEQALDEVGDKAFAGANSDITSLSGLTTALSAGQGGTGLTGGANVGDVLSWDGTTWESVPPAVGGLTKIKVTRITASGVHNFDPDCKVFEILMIAGGGGGGKCAVPTATQYAHSSNGNPGAVYKASIDNTLLGATSVTVTVGGGGAAPTLTTNAGAGGNTVLDFGGGRTLTSPGGFGSSGNNALFTDFPWGSSATVPFNQTNVGGTWPADSLTPEPPQYISNTVNRIALNRNSVILDEAATIGLYGYINNRQTSSNVTFGPTGYGCGGLGAMGAFHTNPIYGCAGNAGMVEIREYI